MSQSGAGAPDGPLGVVHAAGAVVWRERAGRLEVVLVHRPRYKDWSWPKGKIDPGESVPAAAVREVAEETGEAVVLGVPLPVRRYRTPDGRGKQVRYWAARLATDQDAPALAARAPVQAAALTEIDDVVWVGASTAAEMLTREMDRAPLAVAQQLWGRGRLSTRVLALARHGQAQSRGSWPGDEADRPLTDSGRAQAAALAPVLSAFGVREILTSPWERCLQTVQPYAEQTGLAPRTFPELTEKAHEHDPRAALGLVADQVAEADDAVVSMHRPVLPSALRTIAGASRRWTIGRLPQKDPYLRTGEVLVSHITGSGARARVVALEHHRPPSPAT